MVAYAAELDSVRRIMLVPEITRAFWSRRCALPGDALRLHVETRHVPDDTAVRLTLVEDGADEGGPDDVLGEIAGDHRIRGGKLVVPYTVDFSSGALGGDLELEGEDFEFCFVAEIAGFGLQMRSTLLYVPVHPFHPSR